MNRRFHGGRLFSLKENRKDFFRRIATKYSPNSDEFKTIWRAYETAKEASRLSENRESGERQFEHYRRAALILIDYRGVLKNHPRAYIIISAALLHDVVEDFKDWTLDRIVKDFGREIGELVYWMTKFDKKIYHERFCCAPRDFFLIKLADRLDNLSTIWACPIEKIIRKIEETEEFYLPYAKELRIFYEDLCRTLKSAKKHVKNLKRKEERKKISGEK